MPTIGTRYFSETGVGYLYIPALSLAYIYSLNQNNLYFYFALLSLASAVYQHGLLISIVGPGNFNEKPVRREEKIKRFQAAIWDKGGAEDYPADPIEGILTTEHRKASRYPVIALLFLSGIGLLASYLISTRYLLLNIESLDYIGLILLFLLVLLVLQIVLWKPWSSVHLVEERLEDRPDPKQYLRDDMHRFGYFIRDETDLHGTHVNYHQDDGGVFHIELESNLESGEIEAESIDTLAQGYVAFLNQAEVPIEKLIGFIKYDDGTVAQFTIETGWATSYERREITFDAYREKIVDSFDLGEGTQLSE